MSGREVTMLRKNLLRSMTLAGALAGGLFMTVAAAPRFADPENHARTGQANLASDTIRRASGRHYDSDRYAWSGHDRDSSERRHYRNDHDGDPYYRNDRDGDRDWDHDDSRRRDYDRDDRDRN
jgi:hypothetical protein